MTTKVDKMQPRHGCCGPRADSAPTSPVRGESTRTIGPWGTTLRALAGGAAIAAGVAVPHEHPLLDLPGASSTPLGLLIGLVATPLALTVAIWMRGCDAPRLRWGHGTACLVTLLTFGVAQFYPVAVWVSIGAPLLLLAAVGRNGCELLAVPNLVLRRDDYLFCLPFSSIDAWEHRRRHAAAPDTHRQRPPRGSLSPTERADGQGRR